MNKNEFDEATEAQMRGFLDDLLGLFLASHDSVAEVYRKHTGCDPTLDILLASLRSGAEDNVLESYPLVAELGEDSFLAALGFTAKRAGYPEEEVRLAILQLRRADEEAKASEEKEDFSHYLG